MGGFDREHALAEHVLSPVSADLQEVELFLAVRDGQLYVHSNHRPPRHEYPTKIATREAVDLELLVANIIFDGTDQPTKAVIEKAVAGLRVYVDDSLRDSVRYRDLTQEIRERRIPAIDSPAPSELPVADLEPPGQQGFYICSFPAGATVGESFVATIRVSETSEQLLAKGDSGELACLDPLRFRVGETFSISLLAKSDEFEVRPLYPDLVQSIDDGECANWYFDVCPLSAGEQSIEVMVAIEEDGRKKIYNLSRHDLTVSWSASAFLAANWQFMLTALLIPAGTALFIWWKKLRRLQRQQAALAPKLILPDGPEE
ncbi:MAG: hypothetical protein AAF682_00180 [Planctomycetota bacterium]